MTVDIMSAPTSAPAKLADAHDAPAEERRAGGSARCARVSTHKNAASVTAASVSISAGWTLLAPRRSDRIALASRAAPRTSSSCGFFSMSSWKNAPSIAAESTPNGTLM